MSNKTVFYMGGEGYEETWNRVFGKKPLKKVSLFKRFSYWIKTELFILKEKWYDFLYNLFIA